MTSREQLGARRGAFRPSMTSCWSRWRHERARRFSVTGIFGYTARFECMRLVASFMQCYCAASVSRGWAGDSVEACLRRWSWGPYSAATPTSCACPGRAACPAARRRSPCAGGAAMRRAGWPRGTAGGSWGSPSPPATAGETGRPRSASTSTWGDTTVRWGCP